MNWGEFWKQTDTSMSEIWLNGFTNSENPAQELAALARSWLTPPKMVLVGRTRTGEFGYSVGERAYLVDAKSPASPQPLKLRLMGSPASPVINPTFLINNWGDKDAELLVNGKVIPRGSDFRMGHYKTLDFDDGRQWKNVLIVWVKANSTKPIEFAIRPEGYRSSGTGESSGGEPNVTQPGTSPTARAPAYRKWTSGNYSTRARLITLVGGIAFLKKPDGKTIKVPYDKLSPADQKFLDDWRKRK